SSFVLDRRGGRTSTSSVIRLAERFSAFVEGSLRSLGLPEPLCPLVKQSDLSRAREHDRQRARGKPNQSQSTPLPPYLASIVDEILAEGEHGWPGSCSLFYEDYLDGQGRKRRLYSPVMAVFFQI